MNADTALGMPSQHKVLGRAIRRKNLQERSDAYERQHNLGNRTRAELENDVLERLTRNLAAGELLLALFASSLASSRRSTICEPFPQFFNSTEGPRFEELVRVTCALLTWLCRSYHPTCFIPLLILSI